MKATLTYHATVGASKVLEWNGLTFYDGHAVEVDNPAMIGKAMGNRFFDCNISEGADEKAAKASKSEDKQKDYARRTGDTSVLAKPKHEESQSAGKEARGR